LPEWKIGYFYGATAQWRNSSCAKASEDKRYYGMKSIPEITIEDYDYDLPEERIAQFPSEERDSSRLLVYNKGKITDDLFRNVSNHLPQKSVLVRNNARVIRARLHFLKETGAVIEILCLEPLYPGVYEQAFSSEGPVEWKCMVGNLRKWKKGKLTAGFDHNGRRYNLSVEKISPEGDAWRILFKWDHPGINFGEVLESAGRLPLPPYVRREDMEEDYIRYQTIYSKNEGSVAAPTAGLHFTDGVLKSIAEKDIKTVELTLHVGAGTFSPVRGGDISRHEMHRENFLIPRESLEDILKGIDRLIAVGTTSVRTLESLYWLGIKAIHDDGRLVRYPEVDQWEWRDSYDNISPGESLTALLRIMDKQKLRFLSASTRMMIIPGYRFRMIKGMITNFHQPRSTLLLLVSAWAGEDWKRIYRHAMEESFRFLSYGDASIML
jgi:S-adenosylmethionine:tRNA ribosyltransferase-isomerase